MVDDRDDRSREVNRKDPFQYNNPRAPIENYSSLDPRLWIAIIFVEIPTILYWYWWHKRQSRKASRISIVHNLSNAMQQSYFILNDEDATRHERKQAESLQRSLKGIADELNIESDHVDRHYYAGGDSDE